MAMGSVGFAPMPRLQSQDSRRFLQPSLPMLNSNDFLNRPTARRDECRRKFESKSNHLHTNRRRCFYLAIIFCRLIRRLRTDHRSRASVQAICMRRTLRREICPHARRRALAPKLQLVCNSSASDDRGTTELYAWRGSQPRPKYAVTVHGGEVC